MANGFDYARSAKRVIELEQAAVANLEQYIDTAFEQACELMFHCEGKVIVTGMGKSGHIANKIAATLASTGTPSFFVHPGEAAHGDLGMISPKDIVIAISNSGESDEILSLYPVLKRLNIKTISITGRPESTMAREADLHLCIKVEKEACPLGLAPTSSTTATLVMGDALAVALLEARGFTANDFALSHPGGSLGRKLLLRVADVMHTGDRLPTISQDVTISEALLEISRKGLGMVALLDAGGTMTGIYTDGDLRRSLDRRVDLHATSISDVMTRGGITVQPQLLAAEALNLMEQKKINALMVVNDQNQPIGAFHMHDLLRAGVI